MLSKPNVNDMISKIGNRYEVAIAVAKRSREISDKRFREGDKNIKDPVDEATTEIFEGKINIRIVRDGSEEEPVVCINGRPHIITESIKSVISDIDTIEGELSDEIDSKIEERIHSINIDEPIKEKKVRKPRSKRVDE